MNLNTQHLLYLMEIERTRSISQAAANLYTGQPNLSRILRDTEAALGFPVFERTRKGVRPTQKGEQFLSHARNILREAEFVERLGPNNAQPNRFRVCLPRSYRFLELTKQYLCGCTSEQGIDAVIRECHPRQALEMLSSGLVEVAVIRYSFVYQDYFSEQAQTRKLSLRLLNREEYQIVLSQRHPLAGNPQISKAELHTYPELLHRDTFYPETDNRNGLYTVDRLTQLQLLQGLPNAYLWQEVLPEPLLCAAKLVQRPCAEGGMCYQNALVYKPQCAMSKLESGFLDWISQKG